jgi:hypothetical protein
MPPVQSLRSRKQPSFSSDYRFTVIGWILRAGHLQWGQVIELKPQGSGGPFNVLPEGIEQVVRRHRRLQRVLAGVCPAADRASNGGDIHFRNQGHAALPTLRKKRSGIAIDEDHIESVRPVWLTVDLCQT